MGSSYHLPEFSPASWRANCYICHAPLIKNHRAKLGTHTLEHVIPQWLAKAYELNRVPISIEGDKRVTYTNYVVPCCRRCNCKLLGPLEKFLKDAFEDEEKGPNYVSKMTISLWCCKIFAAARMYSEVLREMPESAMDGLNELVPSAGKHVHRMISRKEICHKFLGILNDRVKVSSEVSSMFCQDRGVEFPFSVEAFRTKVPACLEARFDFHLDTQLYAMYLRFGCWMMVACLDGGYISFQAHSFFEAYRGFELAPLQAEEMAAHFFTMASTSRCYMNYVSEVDGGGVEHLKATLAPVNEPFSESPDYAELTHFLRFFTREPRIEGWSKERGITTWLKIDSHGNLQAVGADDVAGVCER